MRLITALPVALVTMLAFLFAAHVAAPVASAECSFSAAPYEATVKLARGAVVGVLTKVGRDPSGIPYAAEVRVSQRVRSQGGLVWRGRRSQP